MPVSEAFARLRARGVRRRLDRPGPPRGHARRAPRGGQGPVPGRRRGGRDRPAQPQVLLPLVKRLAPGLDVKALAAELRERIAEELDYEIEAQNHRAVERAWRGHPLAYVPARRHDALEPPRARDRAARGPALRGGQAARRGRARPLRRDRVPLLLRHAEPPAPRGGRPAPGQLPAARRRPRRLPRLRADARGRRRLPRAGARDRAGRGRPATRTACTPAGRAGYLPDPAPFEPERVLAQLQLAGEWYFKPGFKPPLARATSPT